MLSNGDPRDRFFHHNLTLIKDFYIYHFQHGCHTLLCPFGSAAWYGTCVALAIETQGLTVSINYMLELKWTDASATGQEVYLPEDETLGELIQDNFLKVFNVKLKKCRYCRLHVLISERNKTQLPESVMLSITLFTNSRCQLESIFDKFSTIFGKVIEVPVNESVLVSVVILEKRRSSDVKGMKLAYWNKVCPQMYILDKEKICPEVEVSSSFLKSKIKDTRVLSGIMSVSNNQTDLRDDTTIKLCWDDYVSMMTESYAGAAAVSHRYLVPAMHVSQITFILIFRQILF